jgi:Domain of unknown function (DUF4439)
MSATAAVRALRTAIAAEDAAIFGYGVAGAHLAPAQRAQASRDWVEHEAARDSLAALLAARGGQPVSAAAEYQLPFPVRGAGAAAELAAVLEDRVTAAYLGLVALTDPALRALGARGVQAAALRAAAWRESTLAFPGIEMPAARIPSSTAAHGPAAPGPRSPAPGRARGSSPTPSPGASKPTSTPSATP